MSAAFSNYTTTILVYLGIDNLAVWSLNLQSGVTGIYNFAWIMFQAAGAYTAGVLTLGPATGNGGFGHYIPGPLLPEPPPLLAAGVGAGALALGVGVVAPPRLRPRLPPDAIPVLSFL